MGHIRSTSWKSCTSRWSKSTSSLPLFFSAMLTAKSMALRSVTMLPIMPPGRPQPTRSEVQMRLVGLM